jgi:cell filamentation protein
VNEDDPYLYPGLRVLRNLARIADEAELDTFERQMANQRAAEGVPSGAFDLAHLRAIHRQLFQDIYDWAGEIRTVEISKDGHQFQFRRYIETGMADVHRRLVAAGFLTGLDVPQFAERAGEIIGDINYVHPFREGNGRTQMQYLRLLADRAGHPIDLTRLDRDAWMAASRSAHRGDYAGMAAQIARVARR